MMGIMLMSPRGDAFQLSDCWPEALLGEEEERGEQRRGKEWKRERRESGERRRDKERGVKRKEFKGSRAKMERK